ncbi:LytR/AlgR family response regulator transcription factor [Adhaeribacter radiodurans]|uniref:LytTR family transcriptional regulator n=1 Tax=Adhaeribacter radiodurans TaxID=2745197 RepID=A0A7L7LEB9_9BACT|nr:LytTR family DNA-binding domain-containing protein [Adhaeribacter radiodurans]QMU31188.1 LytTR family transcriptional regulator [Adhaeribacter radiodurans]
MVTDIKKMHSTPDVRLFLLLIPFVNAYNYYLTYTNIQLNWFLVQTFTVDTLQGYAAWWSIRSFIFWLDKRVPYAQGLVKRILLQVLASTVIGLLLIIVTTEILNALLREKPVPLSFYQNDIFIFIIWFLVINGFYVGYHYFQEWQRTEQLRADEKKVRQGGIWVKSGRENVLVAFSEIQGLYVDGDYTVLVTKLKKYLLEKSLDKMEATLPAEMFFRPNRQFIISRQIINGFKRIENGKLILLVQDLDFFPDTIQVSRTKAPAFKDWFQ